MPHTFRVGQRVRVTEEMANSGYHDYAPGMIVTVTQVKPVNFINFTVNARFRREGWPPFYIAVESKDFSWYPWNFEPVYATPTQAFQATLEAELSNANRNSD